MDGEIKNILPPLPFSGRLFTWSLPCLEIVSIRHHQTHLSRSDDAARSSSLFFRLHERSLLLCSAYMLIVAVLNGDAGLKVVRKVTHLLDGKRRRRKSSFRRNGKFSPTHQTSYKAQGSNQRARQRQNGRV